VLTADDWEAIRLTLLVSAEAVGWAVPVGVLLALVLARGVFPGRFVLDAAVYLPMVLPPVVVGWLLLELFGVRGVIGAPLHRWFGIHLAFTTAGAALACGVMVLPVIVRATRLSLEAIDPGLEQAARCLGAGRLDRLATIVLPLALPGLLVGAISAYAASLGEFGAVITFAANIPGQTRTLPLAIYTALQAPDGEALAARLSMVSILLALTGLAAGAWLARRLRAAGGR
jgi:molybdate transport system permease protein